MNFWKQVHCRHTWVYSDYKIHSGRVGLYCESCFKEKKIKFPWYLTDTVVKARLIDAGIKIPPTTLSGMVATFTNQLCAHIQCEHIAADQEIPDLLVSLYLKCLLKVIRSTPNIREQLENTIERLHDVEESTWCELHEMENERSE